MGKAEKKRMFLQECIDRAVSSWQKRRETIRRRWQVPFIFAEWICEGVSNLLKRWAFLDILGHAGRLTVLVAVIFYIVGCPERRMQSVNLRMQVENLGQQLANQQKAKHYQAWQVINIAQGKPGGGGRKDALEDLHKDNVSLAGVDISNAYLPRLNLAAAVLFDANLAEARLIEANLSGAYLSRANLTKTNLNNVNLTGAHLTDANLPGAILGMADLAEANLKDANLVGANLKDANLVGANLYKADLVGGVLWKANLSGANLAIADIALANIRGADLMNVKHWKEIKSIEYANIYDVKNAPDGFVEWATKQGAVSIENHGEWLRLRHQKMEEKKKQEAVNSRGDQKKVR